MILYVNGDSHSAGAEAVNAHAFAEDDRLYWGLGRQPHPDNLRASYGCHLANHLGAILECDAESASSNKRIIRTTEEYLENNPRPDLIVIGWSTWEREEWYDSETNRYWQVNAGGIGHDWPNSIVARYQNWILDLDYQKSMEDDHYRIWLLHQVLLDKKINHLFFTCYEPFTNVDTLEWGKYYLNPYDRDSTYYNWLKNKGFTTVNTNSYHFGEPAHAAWADYLFKQLSYNALTS
jgi:hypothetical protein